MYVCIRLKQVKIGNVLEDKIKPRENVAIFYYFWDFFFLDYYYVYVAELKFVVVDNLFVFLFYF